MNWICTGVAALAALCLYLASPHQSLWRAALRRQGLLRWLAAPLLAGSVASAVETHGFWCGVCIALAGFMTALVVLPYLDAWRRKGARYVG
ncbi:MAG TPA: hypothetical protein VFX55_07675 [Duganella sp.]|nr:hypothetical protein [Duganella sp.]